MLDPEGAIRPGATVVVRNTATNFEQTHVTDANGRFRALQLPLGPYRVTVTLAGFATLVREGITLIVGQTVSLTLRLEVSGVQQEVSVSAEAPGRRDEPHGGHDDRPSGRPSRSCPSSTTTSWTSPS